MGILTGKNKAELFRLTDIETTEVSLVDKAANKRKWAVIKSDQEAKEMAANATDFLNKLTQGLAKYAEFTETVKNFVEKSEAAAAVPATEWGDAMAGFNAFNAALLNEFIPTETAVVTTPVAVDATTTVVETPVTAAATTGTTETVTAPAVTEPVTTPEVVAVTAVTEPVVASTTEVKDEDKLTTAQETLKSVVGTVGQLSDKSTTDEITKAVGAYDNLYISGGLYIDSWDINALAAVCNAICESLGVPDDVTKAAPAVIADVQKRTAKVLKRIEAAKAVTADDGKDLKLAAALLKKLTDAAKNPGTSSVDTAAIQRLIDAAVAKAVAPIVATNKELTKTVETLEAEKTILVSKVEKANSTTTTRASSVETVTTTVVDDRVIAMPNRVGVIDLNSK